MELVADVGAIVDPAGALPFIDGGQGHPEFPGQGRGAFGGGLDVAAGGGGVVRANLCNLMSMGPPLVDIVDATHDSRRV